MMEFTLNGNIFRYPGDPGQPLLWMLRDQAGLTGTKYGCGAGLCGACTVHIDGVARRSCVTPMAAVNGAQVTTIEGLAGTVARAGNRSAARGSAAGTAPATTLHPVQEAWLEEDVAQCGYCQSGQIMAAAALLAVNPQPTDDDIEREQTNLCRCGTYARIRRAIHRAAQLQRDSVNLARPAAAAAGGESP